MDRTDAIAWTISLCASCRLSQAKTLSQCAWSAVHVARASLAELGRLLATDTGIAAKHAIKRVDRFLGNTRIEPVEVMRGVVGFLARPRKRLLVSMDWVEIRQFHCIVLAARIKGRAIPLLWQAYRDGDLFRSQNNLEYGLLRALRSMVPSSTRVVLLADRGFGRTEMARLCQELEFDYILRIKPDVYVRCPEFTGQLLDLPVKVGTRQVLRNVEYRKERPVRQNVAVAWYEDQDGPWFLATNLPRLGALKLTRIFGHRMSIEEYFRDAKSLRNGFALRLTLIQSPERLNRLLLILALAYLLLVMIGLYASGHYRSGLWCSNNRKGECSLFTIGRIVLTLPIPLPPLLRLAHDLQREITKGNWG
jgi:hypothetical protein